MRSAALILSLAAVACAQTPAGSTWTDLSAKRDKLKSFHQEFEVTQVTKSASGTRSMKRLVTIDAAPGQWREKTVSGSSARIRIFDGTELFSMDEDGEEYVRAKGTAKETPILAAYRVDGPDWSKAMEVERRNCGPAANAHPCVVLDAPLKRWRRGSGSDETSMIEGTARVLLDTQTGLLMSSRTVQAIKTHTGGYQT